jgi:ubiquinone/menaquinone biosynthesis C-methylase UbiE
MNVAAYRRNALQVALDPSHRLHLLPKVPCHARKILDVGCHAGHILEALRLPENSEVFGCDINAEALELAQKYLPKAQFTLGQAEALPYENSSFDFVFARGVIVATHIPEALIEFNRVLTMGGRLWLSLHRWKDCRFILQGTWDAHPAKTLAMGVYTFGNSALFHYTGTLVHYPLNRSRIMTFQTEKRMRRELQKAGFGEVTFSRGTYLVVEADKVRSLSGQQNRDSDLKQPSEDRQRDEAVPVAS